LKKREGFSEERTVLRCRRGDQSWGVTEGATREKGKLYEKFRPQAEACEGTKERVPLQKKRKKKNKLEEDTGVA